MLIATATLHHLPDGIRPVDMRPAISFAATGAAVACSFAACANPAAAADLTCSFQGCADAAAAAADPAATLDAVNLGEPSWLLSALDSADASGEDPGWLYRFAGQPGVKLEYEEYMDAAGNIRSAPTKASLTESGPLLLLGAGATRLGGILPDEMPFNIVQKLLRLIPGVNAILPDLSDTDPRKQYQDTWYGTDFKAKLPEAMRSRRRAAEDSSGEDGSEEVAADPAAGRPEASTRADKQ